MKKILALLLAMILVFSLAACGSDKKDEDDKKDKEKVEDKEKDEKDDEDEEEETAKPSKPSKPADDEDEDETGVCYLCEEEFDAADLEEVIIDDEEYILCADCLELYDDYMNDLEDSGDVDLESVECAMCGDEVSDYWTVQLDGVDYDICEDCYDEYMAEEGDEEVPTACWWCEEEFDELYYESSIMEYLCEDCYAYWTEDIYEEDEGEDEYEDDAEDICYLCEDETGDIVDDVYDLAFCEDCYDLWCSGFVCYACGDVFDEELEIYDDYGYDVYCCDDCSESIF